ncbi:MAG: hypothetical protein HFH05_00405 [Lachnospiraceae bacterium]|nr:hypothetical protein [Lachnospiraceae bacterium]MCI9675735.1 hypothetical protein [Lachnospiraceae bacterium]
MKIEKISMLLIPLAAVIAAVAVWGPEAIAQYRDRNILNQIHVRETETGTEGYRYSLSNNERVYIVSKCLNNQIQPESDQNAMTNVDTVNLDYQELTGTYAFVVNHKDSSGSETGETGGIRLCNQAVSELKNLGILPQEIKELSPGSYSEVLYSAIDVPEPRNNVLVWKISFVSGKLNTNKENRLLDAYVDADTGKLYEFYVRTELEWKDIDPDEIIRVWSEYVGLGEPQEYESTNPLSETTPYFKKYSFAGMEEGNTIVTIGFYEGINELYLKISR